MYAVCDEHSSHSFKSDGSPVQRPWIQEEISDEEKENQPSPFKCIGYSCTHTMSTLFTQRTLPFQIPVGRHQPDFEDRKQSQQELPSMMVENGNACMIRAYLSPTPGFFAPFIIVSVSTLTVSAVQIQTMVV